VRIDLVPETTASSGGTLCGLHAKVILADQRIALLGSANLTVKALVSNLEPGAILRDPDVVRRVDRHFRSLMQPGFGILQRITD